MRKTRQHIAGIWIIVKLCSFLLFMIIMLNGFRLTFSDLPKCEEAYHAQTVEGLILLNPVWIGLMGCFMIYCGLVTFRYYRLDSKLKAAVDALNLAEQMNVFKYRLFRIAADATTNTIDLDLYNSRGEIIHSMVAVDDQTLYLWMANKGGSETIINLLPLSECPNFNRVFHILRDQYGFQKSAGMALNITKIIKRESQKPERKVYTEESILDVNNISEFELHIDKDLLRK